MCVCVYIYVCVCVCECENEMDSSVKVLVLTMRGSALLPFAQCTHRGSFCNTNSLAVAKQLGGDRGMGDLERDWCGLCV